MVWRVVEHDEHRWNVSIAAERRANSPSWNLVFSFRGLDPGILDRAAHCVLTNPFNRNDGTIADMRDRDDA